MMGELRVLLEHAHRPEMTDIDGYESVGGYEGLRRAVAMERPEVVAEVKTSGLQGRGGAGFPTWIKWSGIRTDGPGPRYVVCNADEGEPGTFKDRELMLRVPHMIVEGIAIAGYATNASSGFVYVRGEFTEPALALRKAIDQAYERGYLGKGLAGAAQDFDLHIHMGAGSYECGEETALMSSLMGERGQPRAKPPHAPLPVVSGLWRSPTVINNVETYACVPHILRRGGAWYATMGTERAKGTKVFSVSGHVARPGNYEIELGTSLEELLALAGGVTGGELKAVIPGGSSVPILPAAKCRGLCLDYDSCRAAGTMLGSGGFMVFNETTDIVKLALVTARFYGHESCGKCTPCREGTRWMHQVLQRIVDGRGRADDVPLLLSICNNIDGRSYCPLGDAASWPIRAMVQQYEAEFEHWIRTGNSPIGDASVPVLS